MLLYTKLCSVGLNVIMRTYLDIVNSFAHSIHHEERIVQILLCSPSKPNKHKLNSVFPSGKTWQTHIYMQKVKLYSQVHRNKKSTSRLSLNNLWTRRCHGLLFDLREAAVGCRCCGRRHETYRQYKHHTREETLQK